MKSFNNLKLRTKLFTGFGIVLIVTLIIGILGILNLKTLRSKESLLYNTNLIPVAELGKVTDYFQRIRVNSRDIILAGNENEITSSVNKIREYNSLINKNLDKYKSIIDSRKETVAFNIFISSYMKFYGSTNKFITVAESGQKNQAINLIKGDLYKFSNDAQNKLTTLVQVINNEALKTKNSDEANAGAVLFVLMGFIIAGILISITLAIYISRTISNGVYQISDRISSLKNICILNLQKGAEQLARGDLNVKIVTGTKQLNIDSHDEIGLLASNVNEIIRMVQSTVNSVENAVSKVGEVIKETKKIVTSSIEGNLNNRSSINLFEGAFKEVISGLNETLDAIVSPLSEASIVLEKLAGGDLTAQMEGNYKGDYKILKDSINKTSQSLNIALSDVTKSIEATASAAAQISSSAEEIASGSQEQSSQTSEIAAAVEQMTKTIISTSKNAQTASDAARNAGLIAKEGGSSVFDTVEGMNKINEIVSSAANTVTKLGHSSSQIGEIIQVIDDIADQTNLLALNAAIEAARAGDQGRGFAVVADEVRKLAERTTKATKEIEQMIKKIQQDTKEAVNSIAQGSEEVKKGKLLADKAGKSLNEIISGSEKVVDIIMQVASASEEQSGAAEQISRNIEGISAVTEESTSGVQQIARATEDLNRLTLNLQERISAFKIDLNIGEMDNYIQPKNNHGKMRTNNSLVYA